MYVYMYIYMYYFNCNILKSLMECVERICVSTVNEVRLNFIKEKKKEKGGKKIL